MNNNNEPGRRPSGRATTLEGFAGLLAPMITEEGLQKGLDLQLRPTDKG